MTKGLIMLEILKHDEDIANNGAFVPVIKAIEKELKAFEILKKRVNVVPSSIRSDSTAYYLCTTNSYISKEEYDLLKELLHERT